MAGTGAPDEIRAVLDQLLEAQNAGDADRIGTALSERPDAVHLGTDAGEWWTAKQIVDAVAAAGGPEEIQAVADDVALDMDVDVIGYRLDLVRPAGGGHGGSR